MKKSINTCIRSIMIVVFTVMLVSCSGKLTPLSSSLFSVTPTPMEVKGTKIPLTISGKFPEKWFNKNAEIIITPVLKTGKKEWLGTSVTYQGENVAGNEIVVSQASGGNFNIQSDFDYVPEMINPQLYLKFTAQIKNKKTTLPDLKIAQGLITTVALADAHTTNPAIAPDDFQKIIKSTYDANILFLIQQAKLRSSELNSTNIEAWKKLVKDANSNPKQNLNVEIQAYASPDGGYNLNENLAEQREKNTSSYLKKEFNKDKIDKDVYANYTAQDWDGFKKLVEASSLQDKDLVLRVLSMYKDPAEREREIKNISVVYKELAETILPQLRRSRLIANVETIGKTDNELIQAFKTNPSSLSINELLYTASISGASTEKIYNYIIQKYPNDYRAYNNLGAYYFVQDNQNQAKTLFEKAQQIKPDAPEPNMNLGLLAIANVDLSVAEELIGRSSDANTENEALGLLYLKKGDYRNSIQSFGDAQTNNAALAQLLTKNYSQAQTILDNVKNKNGVTHYLEALVAARTNNAEGVAKHLKMAFDIQSSLKTYAQSDLELAKFATNNAVANLLK